MTRWQDGLAPGHTRRDGVLCIGGVPATELAKTYGTPVLAIDTDLLDASIAEFVAAAAPFGIEVAYAAKAFLCVALARRLARTPLALDVCSLGELLTAERAGFPAERITFHGCGKTDDELDAIVARRVGTVVVDGLEELQRLARRATVARDDRPVEVVLRMNTGIEAHTHEFVRTGGDKTKFGMPSDALELAARIFTSAHGLRFYGLHSHIGSQIFDGHAFVENVRTLIDYAALASAHGLATTRIIAGGGFGIPVSPDDRSSIDVRSTLHALAREAKVCAARANLPVPSIGLEPGRALIGAAGTSLYRVMAAKEQYGARYVIVDGGIADNPRPALYDAYHHPLLASRTEDAMTGTMICGRSCENDHIVDAPLAVNVAPGDLVAICTTGAYTYSMASNYNRFPRPAVVAVGSGTHRLVVRRECADDLLRNDCDA